MNAQDTAPLQIWAQGCTAHYVGTRRGGQLNTAPACPQPLFDDDLMDEEEEEKKAPKVWARLISTHPRCAVHLAPARAHSAAGETQCACAKGRTWHEQRQTRGTGEEPQRAMPCAPAASRTCC